MCVCVLHVCTRVCVRPPSLPHTHHPDVVHIWVVFWRHEDQLDPGSQLHAADGGVGKVEEDTEHHGNRDKLQNFSSKGR